MRKTTLKCSYPFRHAMRPRSYCGMSAVGKDKEPRCIWHLSHLRATDFAIKSALERELTKSDCWLEGVNLESVDLVDVNLHHAYLPYANFEGASLKGATITDACLDFACFRSADLTSAILSGSSLKGSLWYGAKAHNASFECTDLTGARLEGLKLDGAFLAGIIFSSQTDANGVSWGQPGEMKEGNFDEAAHIFRVLSNHFRNISNHQRSEEFYYQEMTALHLRSINARKLPIGDWFERG